MLLVERVQVAQADSRRRYQQMRTVFARWYHRAVSRAETREMLQECSSVVVRGRAIRALREWARVAHEEAALRKKVSISLSFMVSVR